MPASDFFFFFFFLFFVVVVVFGALILCYTYGHVLDMYCFKMHMSTAENFDGDQLEKSMGNAFERR